MNRKQRRLSKALRKGKLGARYLRFGPRSEALIHLPNGRHGKNLSFAAVNEALDQHHDGLTTKEVRK